MFFNIGPPTATSTENAHPTASPRGRNDLCLPGARLALTSPDPMRTATDPTAAFALDQAVQAELATAGAHAAVVRLIASGSFFALLATLWLLTGLESWRVYLVPLALHGAASLVLLRLAESGSHSITRLLSVAVDLAAVAVAQWSTLPYSPHPSGVAGFTIGAFALVLVLNGLALSPREPWAAALLASALVWPIMEAGGSDEGARVAAVVLFLLLAGALEVGLRRRRALAAAFASAEVARQLGRRRVEEVEAARVTIESMLAEARDRNERLERLQKDKETLTQLLVHDLRSPLTAIIGNLEWLPSLIDRPDRGADMRAALEDARFSSVRLTAMIGDILDTAKLEEGRLVLRREPTDVAELVTRVARQLRQSGNNQREVLVDAPVALPLTVDRALVTRVVENLGSNALRYTPKGGRLRVSAVPEEDGVALRVQNDGVPIDPAHRERLFGKYQQAGDVGRGGWGLGLYFCRLAVEAHGGTIAVEDTEGWATTFTVRLPARAAAAACAS